MFKKIGPVILITALGFIVYGNSLQGKFVWDDEYLIQRNTYTRSFTSLPKIFTQDIGAGSGRFFGFYRPIQMATYNIDYLLYGLNVWGYHLTNIILHILVCLSIFWLFNIIYGRREVSLAIALLFLVHPMNTATVSYMSGRADSMVNLFMLLSFIFYLEDTARPGKLSYAMIFLAYLFALLTKEGSIIFPFLIVLYHYTFNKKIEMKRFVPLAAMALCYALARTTILGFLIAKGPNSIAGSTTLLQRLPGFFAALPTYAGILILPVDLHMGRGMAFFKFSDPLVIAGAMIFAGLISAAMYFRKREGRNVVFFGIAWFFVCIIPVSNIYPLNAYMAEHWLALPAIGLFLIAADRLYAMYANARLKYYALAMFIIVIAFLGYATAKQNLYWRNSIEFHARTLAHNPYNVKAMTDLARQYEAIGRRDDAIKLYKRAIELNKAFPIPYNNLGLLYHNIGRDDLAVELYKKALENDPAYPDALNNLAVVYHSTGKRDEAIELYKKAIEANPNFAGAYSNLGVLYASLGRHEDAIEAYRNAIRISPDFADPYYNSALSYAALGKINAALAAYQETLKYRPNLPQANNNIALLYYKMGRFDLAVEYADKALALGYKVDQRFLDELARYRR